MDKIIRTTIKSDVKRENITFNEFFVNIKTYSILLPEMRIKSQFKTQLYSL